MDYSRALRRILHAQLGASYPPNLFQPETPLLGTIPELDSMAVVGILTAVEEEMGVHVHDDEITADVFRTYGSLLEFIRSRR